MLTMFIWQWVQVKQHLLQIDYLRLLWCLAGFAVSYEAYLYSLDVRDLNVWPIWYVAPNFIAVFIASSLGAIWIQKRAHQLVWGVASGIIIYECLQLYIAERTFDGLDIIATLIAALVINILLQIRCALGICQRHQ